MAIVSSSRFFQDRVLFTCSKDFSDSSFSISNNVLYYFLYLIGLAPKKYQEENKASLKNLQSYLSKKIGESRLDKISKKINLDFNGEKPLHSRKLVDLITEIEDVTAFDIQSLMSRVKNNLPTIDLSFWTRRKIKQAPSIDNLDSKTLAFLVETLSKPFKKSPVLEIEDIYKKGCPSSFLAKFFDDSILAKQEKQQLCQDNPLSSEKEFYERLSKILIGREFSIGSIMRVHNSDQGKPQYYRVAAKLITGYGYISYVLVPTTKDMKLKPLEVIKGTGFPPSSLDFLSYFITDSEKEIGSSAYKSAEKYLKYVKKLSPKIVIGHSLGGVLAQYRAAYDENIEEVFTFNSPGVPKKVFEAYNKRNNCKPYIQRSYGDIVDLTGDYHIGFNQNASIENVLKVKRDGKNVHSTIVSNIKACTFPGENSELANNERSHLERARYLIGGHLIAPYLRIIRILSRTLFPSRIKHKEPLLIESTKGKYSVHEIKIDSPDKNKYFFGLF